MKKTKIFKSGNSLAVRLPKGYQLDTEEACIIKHDKKIVIFPEKEKWDVLFELLEELDKTQTGDFLKDRKQPEAQKREFF